MKSARDRANGKRGGSLLNKTINEWRDVVHANAVDKGWWPDERTLDEVICLIISELSEALEEYRNGKPYIYYLCQHHDTRAGCPDKYDGCQHGKNEGCALRKPEGIAVEMADVLIRILDYAGHKGIDMTRATTDIATVYHKEPITRVMMNVTYFLSNYWILDDDFTGNEFNLCKAAAYIIKWFERQRIDVWEIVFIKHEYNKTRPFRHGGKRC